MSTVFNVGDLLKFKDDSWWLYRDAGFQGKYSNASLVLVTDSIEGSKKFFYGLVCATGETHLWSHDQFNLVQKGT